MTGFLCIHFFNKIRRSYVDDWLSLYTFLLSLYILMLSHNEGHEWKQTRYELLTFEVLYSFITHILNEELCENGRESTHQRYYEDEDNAISMPHKYFPQTFKNSG